MAKPIYDAFQTQGVWDWKEDTPTKPVCPKCRDQKDTDRWWRLVREYEFELKRGKQLKTAEVIFAGKLVSKVDQKPASLLTVSENELGAEVSQEDWTHNKSVAIHSHWWEEASATVANNFMYDVTRGIHSGNLEVTYKTSNNGNRAFGIRCKKCSYGLMMKYSKAMSLPAQKLAQKLFASFLRSNPCFQQSAKWKIAASTGMDWSKGTHPNLMMFQ